MYKVFYVYNQLFIAAEQNIQNCKTAAVFIVTFDHSGG